MRKNLRMPGMILRGIMGCSRALHRLATSPGGEEKMGSSESPATGDIEDKCG